jgi:hypothetical protein
LAFLRVSGDGESGAVGAVPGDVAAGTADVAAAGAGVAAGAAAAGASVAVGKVEVGAAAAALASAGCWARTGAANPKAAQTIIQERNIECACVIKYLE